MPNQSEVRVGDAEPREKVLLIDDDRTTLALLSKSLLGQGYDVMEAGRLSDARAFVKSTPPDIIVVDGLLPDGSGMDLIAELRKAGTKAKIFFLSSFFRDFGSFTRLRDELHVSGILHKPIRPDDFLGHMRSVPA